MPHGVPNDNHCSPEWYGCLDFKVNFEYLFEIWPDSAYCMGGVNNSLGLGKSVRKNPHGLF